MSSLTPLHPQTLTTAGVVARRGAPALQRAAAAWFSVAVFGQLLFALYVAVFYGQPALQGRWALWNKGMPHGHVAGDFWGNAVVGLHLLFTVLVLMGGALQLVPAVRRRWPVFHRWVGRSYLVGAVLLAGGGIVMLLTRGTVGAWPQHLGVGLNGVVVLVFAALTLRHALARRLDAHRRWALRLWVAVAGVWFFRLGLMLWLVIHRAPVGFDMASFSGPFLSFLSFAQFLIPLAVLQLYFWAQAQRAAAPKLAVATVLGACTLLTAAGVAAAFALMWLPRILKAAPAL